MTQSALHTDERRFTITGRDSRRFLENLVSRLETIYQVSASRAGRSEVATVAPFQAESTSVQGLARRLVDDIVASLSESPTELLDIELANVLTTDDGWRAWGYIRFGARVRSGERLPVVWVESIETPVAGVNESVVLIVASTQPGTGGERKES